MNLALLDKIHEKHILVIGDVMLDRYTIGAVERQSPEAPVPILAGKKTYSRLGGAANVALNIKALGAMTSLVGVVGADHAASDLEHICSEEQMKTVFIKDKSRRTTIKHRYISDSVHLLRVDDEDLHNIVDDVESQFLRNIIAMLPDVSGVVISDYNKGTITPNVISGVLQACKSAQLPVYVDPKFHNFDLYKGVAVFKPNIKELRAALDDSADSIPNLLSRIQEILDCRTVYCTLAAEGIAYRSSNNSGLQPTEKIDIVDVSGAGDTVMAVICLADQCGMEIKDICQLSNSAGRLVCMQSGVIPVTLEELKNEVYRLSADKKNN